MSIFEKGSLGQKIYSWGGYLLLIGAILYFFAPPSWWQFGVTAVEKRTETSDFSLGRLDDNGEKWKFEDERGKVIVVNYWATWCGPCRFEMPGLVNTAKEFEGKDVEFVGVTVDNDLSLVVPFIKEYKITYPILLPGNDPNVGTGGMKLPTTFLYDKNGKLAKKYTGIVLESTLKSDIEDLLQE